MGFLIDSDSHIFGDRPSPSVKQAVNDFPAGMTSRFPPPSSTCSSNSPSPVRESTDLG